MFAAATDRRARRFVFLPVAALGLALAAPAAADDPSHTAVRAKVTVSDNKAGTPKKPRGGRVGFQVTFDTPPQYERPIVQRFQVKITKYVRFNGAKFAACSKGRLNRRGPSGCPKGSIMGTGSVDAYADTVITHPKLTVVNGGANHIYLFVVVSNPARVATAIDAKVTRLRGDSTYGLRLDADVPPSLQIIAGVPVQPVKLRFAAGRGDWLASTGCPRDHIWRGEGTAFYDNGGNSGVIRAGVRCRS